MKLLWLRRKHPDFRFFTVPHNEVSILSRPREAFNNYVDKMRGEGVKNVWFFRV